LGIPRKKFCRRFHDPGWWTTAFHFLLLSAATFFPGTLEELSKSESEKIAAGQKSPCARTHPFLYFEVHFRASIADWRRCWPP
jgi:hypothetical protein